MQKSSHLVQAAFHLPIVATKEREKKMKKIICAVLFVVLIVSAFAYAQQTTHERGTAKHEHVLVGCSFWTYDEARSRWLFHNGTMANRDTLRISKQSAEVDTLQGGYYSTIIILP